MYALKVFKEKRKSNTYTFTWDYLHVNDTVLLLDSIDCVNEYIDEHYHFDRENITYVQFDEKEMINHE